MHHCLCCDCPEGLVPFLDQRVKVTTTCGNILGILRAIGETFLEVEEDDDKLVLTVIQCAEVCFVKAV